MAEIHRSTGERLGIEFLTKEAPAERFPDTGMAAIEALRLIGEEMVLDGDPDHAECPRTAHKSERGQVKTGTGY